MIRRHDTQLAVACELGRQHLRQSRREPLVCGPLRQIPEPDNGQRRTRRRRCGRVGRRACDRGCLRPDGTREKRRDAGGREHQGGRAERGAMPAYPPSDAVASRTQASGDGLGGQITPEVFAERRGARIALVRFLTQRLQYDIIERAVQAFPQEARRTLARLADRGRARRRGRAVGLRDGVNALNDVAWTLRILLADHAHELFRRVGGEPIGPMAGQQLVEQEAERIHVRHSRHRAAEHLLGAGVVGRHRRAGH